MELAPGVQIADNIRLIRRLGVGGMGSVWEAEHQSLQATVALKILSADAAQQSASMVARFRREALAAAQIQSPHVVKIFNSDTLPDGTPYLVMELLEGQDLADRIEALGPRPLDEMVHIVDQVAKALGKAHAVGVVHRDVKPDNVFLLEEDDELFVKVLDFGIAKQLDAKTHSVVTMTGAMVGTPAFMSPEQVLSGKDVDHLADIWSLGVLTYHALTGDIPFLGETLGAMCVAIAGGRYEPISKVRPELPKALDSWFSRCLALDTKDRFPSARAAADALRNAAMGIALPDPRDAKTQLRSVPAEAIERAQALAEVEAPGSAADLKGASIDLPMSGVPPKIWLTGGVVALCLGGALAIPFSMSRSTTPSPNGVDVSNSETAMPRAASAPARGAVAPAPDETASAGSVNGGAPPASGTVAAPPSAVLPRRGPLPVASQPRPVPTTQGAAPPPTAVDRGF